MQRHFKVSSVTRLDDAPLCCQPIWPGSRISYIRIGGRHVDPAVGPVAWRHHQREPFDFKCVYCGYLQARRAVIKLCSHCHSLELRIDPGACVGGTFWPNQPRSTCLYRWWNQPLECYCGFLSPQGIASFRTARPHPDPFARS